MDRPFQDEGSNYIHFLTEHYYDLYGNYNVGELE